MEILDWVTEGCTAEEKRKLFRDNAIRSVTAQAFIFTSAYSDPNAAIVVEPAAARAQFRDVVVEHVTSTVPAARRSA